MTKLLLDSELKQKLNGLSEQVEFCDADGETLGIFIPLDKYRDLFYAALAAQTPFSAEDLRRSHQETGGRTLAEIKRDLNIS